MQPHIELYVLALIGITLHYLKDIKDQHAVGARYGWEKAATTLAISIISSIVVVYLRDDLETIYPVTRFSALVLGYFSNSILFGIIEAKKPYFENENNNQPATH